MSNQTIPKVSVVIPIYNVEKFLEESLTNLLNQTLKDIELICITDESSDNSLEILKKYEKDDRVIITNNEYIDYESAKNKGLTEAKGEFIYFFNPEDHVLSNALDELYKNAVSNESDLVIFKIARFRDGFPVDYNMPFYNFDEVFEGVDFNNFTFTYKDIKNYVMNSAFALGSKLYRKDFIDSYSDFRFDLGADFSDILFHIKSVLRAKKISFLPNYYCHYRFDNPNSKNNNYSNSIEILKIVDIVEEFIKKEGFFEELEEEFYFFKVNQIVKCIVSSHSEDYFKLAKKKLLEVEYKNIEHIGDYLLERYHWIMQSDSFETYMIMSEIADLKRKNEELTRKNDSLKNKNEKLNKSNKILLSSNSWKITKPLRMFKK